MAEHHKITQDLRHEMKKNTSCSPNEYKQQVLLWALIRTI